MSNAIRTVGFIGLGTMGAPMARNLLKAGFALRVYDVIGPAVQALVDAGATAAGSAADAARGADAAVTMLPNSEHVEKALLGTDGVIETLAPGSMVIEMSTIAPTMTDRLAAALGERGIVMVDAPVGRTSQHGVRRASVEECLLVADFSYVRTKSRVRARGLPFSCVTLR